MYQKSTHTLVLTAMLAVISLILSLVKMAIPGLPPFLTLDLAFIPLFLGLLILGFRKTLTISVLKNFLHFLLISREPTGSIANLIVEFVFLSVFVYFYKKNNLKIILGGGLASISITLVMAAMNYFILLPMYGYIINLADIVTNLKTIVTYGIIPFNLIKGVFIIVLFFVTRQLYKRIPAVYISKFKK